jgi:hypothetical protein
MIFVTSIITGAEWWKLRDAAAKQFPNERLAQGEILRRYALSGVAALKAASDREQKRMQWEHQSTQTVAGPEGDKPTTSEY